MGELTLHGLRVSYRTWGQGPPLVLLHSGGSSGEQWQKVSDHLASRYYLIAPDFFGFGASDRWKEPGGLTHDLQAEIVGAVVEQEAGGVADVVGHSYGGAAVVRLWLKRPNLIRSLVLIEPIMSWLLKDASDPLYEESVSVAHAFLAHMKAGDNQQAWQVFLDSRNGAGTWEKLSDKAKARFLAQSEQTVEGFISNLNNHTSLADCRTITVPTTVVYGEATTAPDRRTTELLRDAVPGAKYIGIPGAAHMSPFTHAADVARIIEQHLDRR